jgi:hypothetical protein
MSDQEWMAFLDTLPPDLRTIAQRLLERFETVLERDRSRALEEMQRLERKVDGLKAREVGADPP